jgi:hypothetical protein
VANAAAIRTPSKQTDFQIFSKRTLAHAEAAFCETMANPKNHTFSVNPKPDGGVWQL